MSEKLIDFPSQIKDLASLVTTVTYPYCERSKELGNRIDYINNYVRDKLSQVQPEIMVYGIYNAGKSSIINEMIGADKAVVDDKPTTDKVTYYDFNGYRIADTPGVGAPIAHEKITQEHLKKADVVIFVMSSTGSHDKAQNYERIRDIYNSGKKVIIVLNDKDGKLNDSSDTEHTIELIKLKIGQNLNKVGLENKFQIIAVNALRARTARLKNNSNLYLKSNMSELIDVITHEIKNSDSAHKWRTTVFQIADECRKVLTELDKIDQSSLSEKEIKNFTDLVRQQEERQRNDINSFIERKMKIMSATLPDTIWSQKSNQVMAQNTLKQMIDDNIQQVREKLLELLRHTKELLDENSVRLKIQLKNTCESEELLDNVNYEEEWNELIELIKEGAHSPINEEFGDYRDNTDGSSSNSLGILTALGTSTVAKIASSHPYVAAAIAAVSLIFSLFGKGNSGPSNGELAKEHNNIENARVQAEMQARNELEHKCRYLCMNLEDKIKLAVSDCMSEASKRIITPFKELASKIQSENGKLLECIDTVKQVIYNLDDIGEQLKSKDGEF